MTSIRPLLRTTPNPSELTAAQLVVAALADRGITDYFGLPGGPIIPFFDAVLSRGDTTLYEPRHETTGAFEAMGFYRATGRVPVVVVTAGPGLTNVVTGVAAAALERVPMLVVCGDVAWSTTNERLLQDSGESGLAAERMLGSITRAQTRVARAESAVGQVLQVLSRVQDPASPGPGLVVFPVDRSAQVRRSPKVASPFKAPSLLPVDASAVNAVDAALRRAKRPLLVLGGGARRHAPVMAALVDALQIPFVTTPRGKGVVSELHPLSLRNCGMASSLWARRYMQGGVDGCLVLGTDLDDVSILGTPPVSREGFLAHVDLDGTALGRSVPTSLGIAADLKQFALALTDRAQRSGPLERGAAAIEEIKAGPAFDVAVPAMDEASPIRPHRVIADLEACAPQGTRFVTDIGEHMLFALHYLTSTNPDAFTIHLGLGSMGSGIGSAIGQALGNRALGNDRPICCICGDGGMQMFGGELSTAVQHRLPIVFAVFNDARYNMVFHGYRQTFGRQAPFATPVIDFVKWAESLGAHGERIEAPDDIGFDHFSALVHGPVVLDIRHDANVRIQGEGRVEAIRQMSMLHTLREA